MQPTHRDVHPPIKCGSGETKLASPRLPQCRAAQNRQGNSTGINRYARCARPLASRLALCSDRLLPQAVGSDGRPDPVIQDAPSRGTNEVGAPREAQRRSTQLAGTPVCDRRAGACGVSVRIGPRRFAEAPCASRSFSFARISSADHESSCQADAWPPCRPPCRRPLPRRRLAPVGPRLVPCVVHTHLHHLALPSTWPRRRWRDAC